MKREDLKPGAVYRLAHDVKNPKVDRRGANLRRGTPDDHEISKLEILEKGMRFRWVNRVVFPFDDERKYTEEYLENFDGRFHTAIREDRFGEPNPIFPLILEALEPEPESFDTVISRVCDSSEISSYTTYHLLRKLWEAGRLTELDLSAAYQLLHEESDD